MSDIKRPKDLIASCLRLLSNVCVPLDKSESSTGGKLHALGSKKSVMTFVVNKLYNKFEAPMVRGVLAESPKKLSWKPLGDTPYRVLFK